MSGGHNSGRGGGGVVVLTRGFLWVNVHECENFQKISSKYPNSKTYPDVPIYQNYIISFAFDRDFQWL